MDEMLQVARQALTGAQTLLQSITRHLADSHVSEGKVSVDALDQHQLVLFDLAGFASRLIAADHLLAHAETSSQPDTPSSQLLGQLATLYVAESIQSLAQGLAFRESEFGLSLDALTGYLRQPATMAFLNQQLSAQTYNAIANLIDQTDGPGPNTLDDENRALQNTFRRYANDKVAPIAERVHREDLLIPDDQIEDLARLGCFGLTIPERYGGFFDEAKPNHTAMVVVSEELSRVSLGTAGSLITRPELLSKALLKGGTEAQKEKWLPLIASGQRQVAVAVTEPDYGSDVASLRTTARPDGGGWRLNGTKTWCTFAGRADTLMVLARSNPDLAKAHRGLTLFMVEKPPAYGHSFEHTAQGGHIEGRSIATLGYRGMHSFEVVFDNTFVPADNVLGGEAGLGRGFFFQMHGFGGSRLQTTGRALGVMMAAFDAALTYSRQRQVFGQSLLAYPLTGYKLVRMAMLIQAVRQLAYHAARQMDAGAAGVEAAMSKLLASRAAEWITREAQQLHGGMGYAEEFAISRHFVDARLLAIFEGTEEVLALRIIARNLLESAARDAAGDT